MDYASFFVNYNVKQLTIFLITILFLSCSLIYEICDYCNLEYNGIENVVLSHDNKLSYHKKCVELYNKDLFYLFKYFNSLKREHNYEDFFHENLKEIKNENIDILEIGTARGDGLASFYFYFPNSNLIEWTIIHLEFVISQKEFVIYMLIFLQKI